MAWNGRLIVTQWGRCLSGAIVLIVVAGVFPVAAGGQGNVIKGIALGRSGVDMEIELESATDFAVRDELVILRIGSRTFTRSRHPADGDLKRLIFLLRPDEFARFQPGESVTVEYGRSGAGPRQNFGQLTRTLLGK
jgi:hypothetical protein